MTLFLFLACNEPECSALDDEPQETTFLYPRKNTEETNFDMDKPPDTGLDTGDTGSAE
tara:strand:- start:887 stop:1060 length:174 start_codon:yes stop_codon:yes gene_type:complete